MQNDIPVWLVNQFCDKAHKHSLAVQETQIYGPRIREVETVAAAVADHFKIYKTKYVTFRISV